MSDPIRPEPAAMTPAPSDLPTADDLPVLRRRVDNMTPGPVRLNCLTQIGAEYPPWALQRSHLEPGGFAEVFRGWIGDEDAYALEVLWNAAPSLLARLDSQAAELSAARSEADALRGKVAELEARLADDSRDGPGGWTLAHEELTAANAECPEPGVGGVVAGIKSLAGRADGLEEERDRLLDLVYELSEETPCRYDHNDLCQEHFHRRPCANERALEELKRSDAALGPSGV